MEGDAPAEKSHRHGSDVRHLLSGGTTKRRPVSTNITPKMSQTGTLVPVLGKLIPPLEVSTRGDGALVGVGIGASVVVVVVGVTSTGTITAAACRVMVSDVVVLQLPLEVTIWMSFEPTESEMEFDAEPEVTEVPFTVMVLNEPDRVGVTVTDVCELGTVEE